MKLKQEARALKRKALSSVTVAMAAFNSPHDEGRTTSVLLHMQHCFEMLLKAALVQAGEAVFDKDAGTSIGFDKAVNNALNLPGPVLTEPQAGTLRAIGSLRDQEQHWLTAVDEGLLYVHLGAAVTLFDDVLHAAFGERLADHLPRRVLPVGTEFPQDWVTLIDRDYEALRQLMSKGRRAGAQARALIGGLLAMEAHVAPDAKVTAADVRRVEKGVREGKTREQVFPRFGQVGMQVSGQGTDVQVRIVKGTGPPVRLVKDGDPGYSDAAAFRDVDLQKKYHRGAAELAESLGLSGPKTRALREHLGIDQDDSCRHVFEFGKAKHPQYSDNAYKRMRDALKTLDAEVLWPAHRPRRRGEPRPACPLPDCQADVG